MTFQRFNNIQVVEWWYKYIGYFSRLATADDVNGCEPCIGNTVDCYKMLKAIDSHPSDGGHFV